MKKNLCALCIMLFLISSNAIAKELSKIPAYVSTSANATKEVSPNVAYLTFSVETRDKTLLKATNTNKILSNNLVMTLKRTLPSSDVVSTSNFSVNPIYTSIKDNKTIIEGYMAKNSVKIKTTSIKLIPTLIENAIKVGVTNINNLDFNFENPQSICDELYKTATKDSLNQAKVIAQSLNTNILGIRKINASCSSENSNYRPYRMYNAKSMMDTSDVASSYQIEEGTITIRADISAEFNLE